jgi:acetoacetyl-CoA reductase
MAKQRIAVVTGGMGGLGETISTKMADAGYRVVVTYSPSNTKYRSWLEDMKPRDYSFSAFPVDVVDYDDCARKMSTIQAEVGAVDILVNNAGITRDMTFKKMSKADWDAVMRTNLDSCFNMTKQVMDGMVDRGWGRVINVSSVNGQKGAFGQTNYSAAKAGIHGFTKALALEVARKGVTVITGGGPGAPIGRPLGEEGLRVTELLWSFYAVGALTTALAAFAFGRLATVSARDIKAAADRGNT